MKWMLKKNLILPSYRMSSYFLLYIVLVAQYCLVVSFIWNSVLFCVEEETVVFDGCDSLDQPSRDFRFY